MKDTFDTMLLSGTLLIKWSLGFLGINTSEFDYLIPKAASEIGWEFFAMVFMILFLAMFQKITGKSLKSYLFKWFGLKDEIQELKDEIKRLKNRKK